MKPFVLLLVFFLMISCSSISTPCYFGVLSLNEHTRSNDSTDLKLQEGYKKHIATETERIERLHFFNSRVSINRKLKAMKEEIRTRTAYVFPSKRIQTKDGREIVSSSTACEIIFMVVIRNGHYLINFSKLSESNKRLQLLNEENVDSITVLQSRNVAALYGFSGRCGVVILHAHDKKLKNELSKLEF